MGRPLSTESPGGLRPLRRGRNRAAWWPIAAPMPGSADATRTSSPSIEGYEEEGVGREEPHSGNARYEIIAEHGRGGSGRVLRAYDRVSMRDVAIKELR